jgi:hypothetical protein
MFCLSDIFLAKNNLNNNYILTFLLSKIPMTPSTVQKFRIVSPASKGLSMSQIALWKPFQYFLLGISHSEWSIFRYLTFCNDESDSDSQ